jgi:glycosyltransferase involved in cell wall biosynthesis
MSGDPQVADAERRLATRARLLIGTSGPVLEHLVEIAPGRRSLLLENGVDVGHFSAVGGRPKAYEGSQGGVLVYVGALDERFDIATVRAVAEAFPATRIALLGPIEGEVRERFKGAPNVIALGPQPYDQIPAFLGHATIALLPLTSHPANRGRSPMKLYEYAAAGLPVVATRTVELERRNPAFVESAPDQDAFVAAVGRLLADDALRRKRGEDARREAAEHDWAGIAARLASEIERLEGK